MKIPLLFVLFLSLLVTEIAARKHAKAAAGVSDFVRGFALGLGLERLAPSVERCFDSLADVRDAVFSVINAIDEGQDFYNLANNVTFGAATLSPLARRCVEVPMDVMEHIKADYLEKFNYSMEKYIPALLLNLAYRTDEVATNSIKINESIVAQDYLHAGYYAGSLLNAVFNVTSTSPIPVPGPMVPFQTEAVLDLLNMHREFALPDAEAKSGLAVSARLQANWTDIHDKFQLYFHHSMIVLNYTKWINATTFYNLNFSIASVETLAYNVIMEFSKSNVKEAVLKIIDTTLYLNALFNGIYFTVTQVPAAIFKDTVFEHVDYLWLNTLLHSGYFIFNGYKLATSLANRRYLDVARRATVIMRKFLYFDPDVLEEIHSKISVMKI